ncbi:amidohydrolase [Spongiibacter sp. KMU-166]|uniref:Amidohydrolase n=1 Tax=Spongiibacter thalassae TaxID=2721624 RepID=A0ABX1GG66_9GAMM|nr:amidohydrolase [Spongiibacter thalassae]NKI17482.1 amidohydrolase [Spongiibacter thalassae]
MSTVKLCAIQSELVWQNAPANRAQFERLLPVCKGADVIVLPEMFSTGFSMNSEDIAEAADGPTSQWLLAQAAHYDCAISGSVAVRENGEFFNRLFWATPDGTLSHYDKHHLFRMAREHEHYSPGQRRVVVEWRGLRYCLQVCYDLRFPVFSRNRDDYDVLIYVANWPAQRAYAWRTLLPARAIENQSYVVGVNRVGSDGNGHPYSGDSGIYDFMGKPMASLAEGKAGILQAELDAGAQNQFRQNFPAAQDADPFELVER